jgi:transcriptional regulator with XRE-family HTH domain
MFETLKVIRKVVGLSGKGSVNMGNGGLPRILKFFRAKQGWTQEQLAERLSVSLSLIAQFETGRRVPKLDTARQMDALFDTGNLFYETALDVRMAVVTSWFQPWTDHESEATMIRAFQPLIIPGLLQTEAYARAILTDAGQFGDDISEALGTRLKRQEVLFRTDRPTRYIGIFDETVLHRPIGGPSCMRDQLHWIVKACERPNIRVHVVPGDSGAYAGLNGPFDLATLDDGRTVAFEDGAVKGQVLEASDDVVALEGTWESIREYALPCKQSLELITRVAESWT